MKTNFNLHLLSNRFLSLSRSLSLSLSLSSSLFQKMPVPKCAIYFKTSSFFQNILLQLSTLGEQIRLSFEEGHLVFRVLSEITLKEIFVATNELVFFPSKLFHPTSVLSLGEFQFNETHMRKVKEAVKIKTNSLGLHILDSHLFFTSCPSIHLRDSQTVWSSFHQLQQQPEVSDEPIQVFQIKRAKRDPKPVASSSSLSPSDSALSFVLQHLKQSESGPASKPSLNQVIQPEIPEKRKVQMTIFLQRVLQPIKHSVAIANEFSGELSPYRKLRGGLPSVPSTSEFEAYFSVQSFLDCIRCMGTVRDFGFLFNLGQNIHFFTENESTKFFQEGTPALQDSFDPSKEEDIRVVKYKKMSESLHLHLFGLQSVLVSILPNEIKAGPLFLSLFPKGNMILEHYSPDKCLVRSLIKTIVLPCLSSSILSPVLFPTKYPSLILPSQGEEIEQNFNFQKLSQLLPKSTFDFEDDFILNL